MYMYINVCVVRENTSLKSYENNTMDNLGKDLEMKGGLYLFTICKLR